MHALCMAAHLRRGQHDQAKLTGGQQTSNPVLDVVVANVVARRDNTALVEASVQLHDDLAGTMVIDKLKLADVSVFLRRRTSPRRWRR